jgi:lipopolysaccharide transport system permease protein
VPSDGIPYVLFAFVGTSVWTTFQRALNDASVSIVGAGTIISKVYFPRVLVPISSVLTAAIDFAPICVVILIMIFVVGVFPGWPFVTFPLFILLMLVLALAVGLWVTVLDAMIRDIRFFIPYGLQILFYACPIMYSASIVPERWKILYRLNPLVGILEGFRWSLIAGAPSPRAFEVIITSGFAVLLLAGGLAAFARLEQMAVDRI